MSDGVSNMQKTQSENFQNEFSSRKKVEKFSIFFLSKNLLLNSKRAKSWEKPSNLNINGVEKRSRLPPSPRLSNISLHIWMPSRAQGEDFKVNLHNWKKKKAQKSEAITFFSGNIFRWDFLQKISTLSENHESGLYHEYRGQQKFQIWSSDTMKSDRNRMST